MMLIKDKNAAFNMGWGIEILIDVEITKVHTCAIFMLQGLFPQK